MNLTVDQMDVLNFRLTEVSLELLGNRFYDIFGQKCDTLGSLYRSKSGSTNREFAVDSDLVKVLNIEDVFSTPPPDDNRIGGNRPITVENINCDMEDGGSSSDLEESDDLESRENQEQNRSK